MKPQNLRIGNIVSHTNDNGTFLCKITATKSHHVEVVVKGVSDEWRLRYDQIKPVKITEEYIRQMGFRPFKREDNKFYDEKLEVQLVLNPINDSKMVDVYEYDEVYGHQYYLTSCYFVHDLQNTLFDNFNDIEYYLTFENF